MRVFITGGTGFIGSAVVQELLEAGHEVAGLVRSDASAAALAAAGAEPVRGALDDLDLLTDSARSVDGVVHVAFPAEYGDFTASVETDRRAVTALGRGLAGTDRPLVVPSGTAMFRPGSVLTEEDPGDAATAGPRRDTEIEVRRIAMTGVRASVVRLGTSVHGSADRRGFVPGLVATARQQGVSAYLGDGSNRWPAVHQLDAAHLFRLALEAAPAGATLHAVGDEGIPFRAIAEAIGRGVGVPTIGIDPAEAPDRFPAFGVLAGVLGADIPASSDITRRLTGWTPTRPGLLQDLAEPHYFEE